MAAPRTKKPRRKPAANSLHGEAKSEARKKSLFTRVGDEAKDAAQRKLLLDTLKKTRWSLTAAAEALEMGAIASVIRALRDLAPEEYEAARADGRIAPGPRG